MAAKRYLGGRSSEDHIIVNDMGKCLGLKSSGRYWELAAIRGSIVYYFWAVIPINPFNFPSNELAYEDSLMRQQLTHCLSIQTR